jgi:hypothetical protein
LVGTLILGAFFGAWLLPEFFQPDTFQFSMGGLRFYPWFILTEIGWSVLMTWAYNNTGKSSVPHGVQHLDPRLADKRHPRRIITPSV